MTPTRTYREQQRAPSVGSGFSALLAAPARGAFVMPANAVLAIKADGGYSAYEMVTLTAPDGSVRTIDSPGMNPGARSVINGVVTKGTRVEARGGLDVQIEVSPLTWATIACGL